MKDLSYSPALQALTDWKLNATFSSDTFSSGCTGAAEFWFTLLQMKTAATEAANDVSEEGKIMRLVEHLFFFAIRNKKNHISSSQIAKREDKGC